jgi:hypothetical protein
LKPYLGRWSTKRGGEAVGKFDNFFAGSASMMSTCSAASLGSYVQPERVVERVVVEVPKADPRQAAKIEALEDEVDRLKTLLAAKEAELEDGPRFKCEYCGHSYYEPPGDGECDDCGGTVVPKEADDEQP